MKRRGFFAVPATVLAFWERVEIGAALHYFAKQRVREASRRQRKSEPQRFFRKLFERHFSEGDPVRPARTLHLAAADREALRIEI